MVAYVYLAALWLLFGSTHSLFATAWWKGRVQRISGRFFPYYRLSYSLLSFIILLVIVYYEWRLTPVWLWRPGLVWQLLAGVAALGGVVIMFICIWRYFFYLSGIDVLLPKRAVQLGLTTGGLNRYVRHPLYAGTLLAVWSCWLMWPELGYLISCCMITLYTCMGTVWEERKLRAEFGEAYRAYQQEVPMLVPWKGTPAMRRDNQAKRR